VPCTVQPIWTHALGPVRLGWRLLRPRCTAAARPSRVFWVVSRHQTSAIAREAKRTIDYFANRESTSRATAISVSRPHPPPKRLGTSELGTSETYHRLLRQQREYLQSYRHLCQSTTPATEKTGYVRTGYVRVECVRPISIMGFGGRCPSCSQEWPQHRWVMLRPQGDRNLMSPAQGTPQM